MEDKLKQFVNEHREELDAHEPRTQLWEHIDQGLQHSKKRLLLQRLAMAASLLLLVLCGTWAYRSAREPAAPVAMAVLQQPQIEKTEDYYTAVVQVKNAELSKYCTPQPELCAAFESDLTTLTKAYNQLKKEYDAAIDKKPLLEAMRINLEMQVQLVNRQLQIMETVQQKKQTTHFI